MKKIYCLLLLCALCIPSVAQEYPKLRELSDKEYGHQLKPFEKKGEWGYVNEKENFRIKANFESADEYKFTMRNGKDTVYYAKVGFGGKFGFLNDRGLFLLVPEFEVLSDFDNGSAVFTRNGQSGVVDATGKILVDGYDDIKPFDQYGLAWFRKDGLWGACGYDGKTVFANEYQYLPDVPCGTMTLMEIKGKLGLLSFTDKRIALPACADWIGPDMKDAELVLYRKDGKFGCFHANGKNLLSADFDYISSSANDKILASRNGLYGLYDKSGNCIFEPVMMTDQVSEGLSFYQLFSAGSAHQTLKVCLNDNVITFKEFDDIMFKEKSKEEYSIKTGADRVPYWLKGHYRDIMSAEEYRGFWRFDKTFYSRMKEGPEFKSLLGVPYDGKSYVTIGRNKMVIDTEGFGMKVGGSLESASLTIDSLKVPCGSWLAPLFLTINKTKLAAYDQKNGTNLAKVWSTMSAKVCNKGFISDSEAVAVVDILVDDILMQKVMVKFSKSGSRKLQVKLDGILYNQDNYVHPGETRCFFANDMLILSICSGGNNELKTIFYSASGSVVTELNDLFGELILSSYPQIVLLGRDSYTFCKSTVDMEKRTYTKEDLVMDSNKNIVKLEGCHACFYDKETMLLKAVLDTEQQGLPVPVLKYADGIWDGQRIVGVSANHWDKMEESKWFFLPRVKAGTFTENINGYLITVYPVDENGIAIYSINPDVWSNEGVVYGYIGYDHDFFTQAVFKEARPFVNGEATVNLAGVWTKMKMTDFGKYMTDASGAIVSDNYEVGTVIFKDGKGKDGIYEISPDIKGRLRGYRNTYTGKHGFVNTDGVMVTAPIYDGYEVKDDVCIVWTKSPDGKILKGMINHKGNVVIPVAYDEVSWPVAGLVTALSGDMVEQFTL